MLNKIPVTTLRAVFLGTDGSMGLKHGRGYNIKIYSYLNHICVDWGGKSACPYTSIQALSKNWEIVSPWKNS